VSRNPSVAKIGRVFQDEPWDFEIAIEEAGFSDPASSSLVPI